MPEPGPPGEAARRRRRRWLAIGLVGGWALIVLASAVWSSAPHAVFSKRVRQAGFAVEELKVKAGPGRRKASHVVWLAVKR